jgi:hypothetical protein
MSRLLSWLFGCPHEHTTFPQTISVERDGELIRRTYQCCLDCGDEFLYDWNQMKVDTREERGFPK